MCRILALYYMGVGANLWPTFARALNCIKKPRPRTSRNALQPATPLNPTPDLETHPTHQTPLSPKP